MHQFNVHLPGEQDNAHKGFESPCVSELFSFAAVDSIEFRRDELNLEDQDELFVSGQQPHTPNHTTLRVNTVTHSKHLTCSLCHSAKAAREQ